MATNPYMNFYNAANEQKLIQDLNTEFVQWAGMDVHYLPRTLQKEDAILGEDVLSAFNGNHVIEMAIENVDSFGGDGDFMSKFGFEMRDEMTLVVSTERFKVVTGMLKPLEGDLIFFPLSNGLFEIRHVEDEQPFYPTGILPVWRLKCVLFRYSQETFATGVPEVDALDAALNPATTGNDPFADNTAIQNESDQVLDFTEKNPFGNF